MKVNLNFIKYVILELEWLVMTYSTTKTLVRGKDASFKSMKTSV